ncbi:MAG: restriction endonuclease subunit S [Veillonella sp.]|uniref:restriction endonuclease subunit S n=1 Tax=Veillonella sp. TaxID=1926307 RepID=UPI00290E9F3F|nr:restriction endonuclease subunit S [Veillonella sp.]MDU6274852.1 restriction endonuclease subunit S [Veillonella sp.]
MSKEKRRVPKLRFPGFTEDWEQRKLGSLATVEMNKRIFKEQTTIKGDIPFYKIGTFGSDADSFISRELFKEYKNKYPYPNIGDILISASGSIGRTVVYNGEDAYYQDSNIVWLNHNGKIDNSFLLQFYNQVKWAGLEGSTIKRLYNKNILETNIALPKIEEQRLIGKFFELVDRSITLHQRKLNNLKLKKKALLQKLFPKNEERYPELRFPGFTDAWEQRKFKDIAFKRGKISEADLPYVEFEDINSGIGTLNKNISQKVGHKKGLLFEAGDVLFGKLRPYLQNWLLCQFAGIAVGDFWVLQPQNVSSAFLYYLIQSEAYQSVANISSGTKMPRSSWPLVSETLFSIPKYKEANMIGEFFLLIDRTITLHQRKLDHLQLQKKALLQQMFV